MATRRVMAFYMDEEEAAECVTRMPGAVRTDSFFLGEVDDADVDSLAAAGVIIQELDAEGRPQLREAPQPVRSLGRGGRTFGMAGPEAAAFDFTRAVYYRVQLSGPMLEQWRAELAAAGAPVHDVLADFQFTAKMDSGVAEAVQALPFVRKIELETPDVSMPREIDVARLRTEERTGAKNVITYDIILREDSALLEVLRWLEEQHVNISASAGNKIRVHLLEDSPVVEDCANLPDVAFIEPYLPPRLHNDLARVLLGLEGKVGSAAFRLPYEGEGQIVGVADTGLDEKHPDLAPARIAGVVALGRPGDASDPNGHGTHVAGSAVGDGTASGGQLRGTAPKAKLFFQSVLDARAELGGLPFRMHDLFDEAYRVGVRVHNNSWGAATQSSYRVSSNEVDDYVFNHKDLLVVISAGNEGTGKNPESGRRNAATGCVEWLSVGSPATAKNALTVGASQNSRSDPKQGYSTQKYGEIWPDDYADAPIKDEAVSGNPESLAAFSSRGPCDTYRIKPDVVAPGTDILSCRSSRAPLRNFWGPHTAAQYAFMGGTSMSAPLVAGCAAAIREYYKKKQRNHEASAALVRATIVNSTRWLSGPPAVADHANTPNYHQGFGCVYMPRAVPNKLEPKLKLAFSDLWQKPEQSIKATGERRRFTIKVRAGYPLRICLAYTDPPGPAIVNNLNLLVQGPDKKKFMGNEQVPMTLNIPDPTNNVEIVRVESPAAGVWTIQISASNLLKPPQDFALVVTGDLNGDLLSV